MKAFTNVVYCLVLSAAALYAQERISVLNGQFSIAIPEGVILVKPYTEFASDAEREKYYEDKISVRVSAVEGKNIVPQAWLLSEGIKNLIQKRTVTEKDFLNLLSEAKSKPVSM